MIIVAASLLLAERARADDGAPLPDPDPAPSSRTTLRVPLVIVENLIVTLPAAIYYWGTPGQQKEDWALHWDWPSWKEKATSLDSLVLDTNKFEANAIRHPMVGALTYQIGRTNGMSPGAATLLTFGMSVFWEYFVEYKEQPSINDIFANTSSGILVGEPLFQVGLAADRKPTLARRVMGLAVSPFHQAQSELGLSPLPGRTADEQARFSASALLAGIDQQGQTGHVREVRLGLELETFGDRRFGAADDRGTWTSFGGWNRVVTDVRVGDVATGAALSGGAFRSTTTYAGWLDRDTDDIGIGRRMFIGVGGGFDVVDRRLPAEWDKYAAFQLATPRVAVWWQWPRRALALEAAASGELGMVQSHALGMMLREPNSSIVLTRGYYYGTGIGAQVRAQLEVAQWTFFAESVAHQFWSFDEHSHGGFNDPRDLVDLRVTSTAIIGYRPIPADDVRVELFGEHVVREGTGDNLWRRSTEVDAGLGLRLGF